MVKNRSLAQMRETNPKVILPDNGFDSKIADFEMNSLVFCLNLGRFDLNSLLFFLENLISG